MNGQLRVYSLLSFLVITSWFLADLFEETIEVPQKVAEHSPADYFSSGYVKKVMDLDGLLKNKLMADGMIHYSDDGTTHLENPIMILYNPDLPPWVIQSDAGILEADGDHLLLSGQVYISRDAAETLEPFNLNTSELQVLLSTSYAETDQWAELFDSKNRTEGVGLEITFSKPVDLKFLSKVKGRYELN